ncbi:MAG: uracil-DNA glycosylase [Candidatus Pacearchaeota archaeon]
MFRKIIIYFLRIILLTITFYLIYKQDFLFALASLIATLIAFFPILIKKNYKIDLPWIIEFLIAFALMLHIIGSLFDWYNKAIFFSSLMHILGTTVIALLAFIIVYSLNLTKQMKLSIFMIGFFTFIFSLAIGTLWEIGEFILDQTIGTNFQKDYGLDPIVDTMWDLIWDGIAGLVIALIGASLVRGYHELVHPFEKLIKKIIEKEKEQIKKLKKRFNINKKVNGYGNKKARVMLVGEAPGAQEIKQGMPFVGPAGKLLDKILKKNKINRNKLYITNLIKIKLPKNRKPTEKEIKKWLPKLKKEIKKIKPKIIVLLGETTTEALLNKSLKKIRGKIIKKDNISYIATYHPSAARFPKIKKIIEKDFKLLRKKI